jgi:hypothetical protein
MLTSPAINWDVAVFDFNGTLLGKSSSTTSADTLSFVALPAGSYYIEVISNESSLPEVPYKLEVDYQGSRSGQLQLSSDDGVPDSSLFSTDAGDVIGMLLHAPSYPMLLDEISFYIESINGAGTGGDGSFYVWLADYFGTIIDPFLVTPVSGTLQKSSQLPGWFNVSLSDSAITVQSDFVVGIGYDGNNTPTIGIDSLDNGRTFQWDSATTRWRTLEASAFLRAKVSYPQTPDRVLISLPAELQVEPADSVSIPIKISNVPTAGVDSLDLEIYYEPSTLRFTALSHENTLTSDWQMDRLNFQPAGRIYIQMSGGSKISNAGDLLNIQFHVQETALSDTVELSLNLARLNGGQYLVETESAKIIIMTTTPVRETPNQPREFVLWQNYPNPFNPETRIQYNVPRSTHVKIEIFNLNGQNIRTLVDRSFEPGKHEIEWDGQDERGMVVVSGVYIYRIQAGSFTHGMYQ